jgi:hypothetical protein
MSTPLVSFVSSQFCAVQQSYQLVFIPDTRNLLTNGETFDERITKTDPIVGKPSVASDLAWVT